MRNAVAVVGEKDSVLAFKAIGLDVFPVSGEMNARECVKEIASTYAVIFITDGVARQIDSLVRRYRSRTYPVIVPIPSAEGNSGFGMLGIKNNVEKALGADILFDRGTKE
jgi:V/A-type H+-transporting ATPase subunit F